MQVLSIEIRKKFVWTAAIENDYCLFALNYNLLEQFSHTPTTNFAILFSTENTKRENSNL